MKKFILFEFRPSSPVTWFILSLEEAFARIIDVRVIIRITWHGRNIPNGFKKWVSDNNSMEL